MGSEEEKGSDYGVSDLENLEEEGLDSFEVEDLIKKMDRLQDSIDSLTQVFTRAESKLNQEDDSKHDQMLSQNRRIANGIIGLADRLKQLEKKIDDIEVSQPVQQAPPTPPQQPEEPEEDIPEPPAKKGFFSRK